MCNLRHRKPNLHVGNACDNKTLKITTTTIVKSRTEILSKVHTFRESIFDTANGKFSPIQRDLGLGFTYSNPVNVLTLAGRVVRRSSSIVTIVYVKCRVKY